MELGLHESLLTTQLRDELANLMSGSEVPFTEKVDDEDQAHVLARHVQAIALQVLSSTKDPERRLAIANDLVRQLERSESEVVAPTSQLMRVDAGAGLGTRTYERVRPSTPLSEAALLTNAHDEPNLGSELRAELDTSDEVDLLCAFVKWHGIRLLEPQLSRLRERGAAFRVITTTYMGATERAALDRLVREFGAEVKIQYDAQRTRLHAKAWLFGRNTEFDTAYVGSSNLSRAALLDGVEWNVRLSRTGTPALLEKFRATFTTYWNDSSFETYDPDRDRDRLDDALNEASGRTQHDRVTISLAGLEVRPFSYQQEMLEALEVERSVHDRHRNLVVAATGTGKTVIAALDYRRLCQDDPQVRPRLLFIAHRREILEQSLRTYREVLADANFGELYVGGARPERWEHVFASVQSLTSYGIANIPADAFDIVVIDEFHHAQAATYRRIINHLAPTELLGLTATPERADGMDVRSFFGGRTAAELRLWDALGADLLCPFHYFAVADGTDLRGISWARGRYDENQLSNVYTGNKARAAIVLTQLRDKVLDPGAMRALGFCVSVAHAEFMAATFNEAGVPALAVSGQTPQADRARPAGPERSASQCAVCGRSLQRRLGSPRRGHGHVPQADGKRDSRPPAVGPWAPTDPHQGSPDRVGLRGLPPQGVSLRRQAARPDRPDAPWSPARHRTRLPLPAVWLPDRDGQESQTIVLDNIKSQIANRWQQIVAELRSYGEQDLGTFLDESGIELSDILRRGSHSWTRLRRDAGLETRAGSALEDRLLKRVRAFAHVDDRVRADAYSYLLADDSPEYGALSPHEQRLARMLYFSLWPDGGGHSSYDEGLAALRRERATRDELATVVDLSFDAARHHALSLGGRLAQVPLSVHARYQREEILAALDFPRNPNSFREGVWYSADLNVDAFFVTLKKSESDYSPTTMYQDYPISPTLFHWESQSTTSISSPTGSRYLNGTSTVLLFARATQKDEFGTSPYLFLGPATFGSHTGDRPIAITWKLQHALPSDFFNAATVAAS